MDIVIQTFLKWGEFRGYLSISFWGYGIFFKIFKGKWDTWDSLPGPIDSDFVKAVNCSACRKKFI